MSQSADILRLLKTGGWFSTRQILAEVPSIVHSRISDLRAQGHRIEHRRTGAGAAGSEYRLLVGGGSVTTAPAPSHEQPGTPLGGDDPWRDPAARGSGEPRHPSDTRPLVSSSPLSGVTAQAGPGLVALPVGCESTTPSADSPGQLPLFGVAA